MPYFCVCCRPRISHPNRMPSWDSSVLTPNWISATSIDWFLGFYHPQIYRNYLSHSTSHRSSCNDLPPPTKNSSWRGCKLHPTTITCGIFPSLGTDSNTSYVRVVVHSGWPPKPTPVRLVWWGSLRSLSVPTPPHPASTTLTSQVTHISPSGTIDLGWWFVVSYASRMLIVLP